MKGVRLKMIDFDEYPILKNNLSTLKETSIDRHDGNTIRYMTNSDRAAVNFDNVKKDYIKTLSLSETPKSNDALFLSKDNKLIFVEFKNGFMDGEKKFSIRKKIYDSIIILTDILNTGISSLRDKMEYVLVYNEAVNANEKEVLEKNRYLVQHSKSYDSFAKSVSKLAKKEYICFGVSIFENYCFGKVHTYTEAEFEEFLISS